MTPTTYDTADLLAETCRRRWAQQFDSHAPDCPLCDRWAREKAADGEIPPTDHWTAWLPTGWPAPRPGTHESDLYRNDLINDLHNENGSGWTGRESYEFGAALRWSRANKETA